MSVDVYYYSFSPSRADKEWPHFVDDITALRQRHAPWEKYCKEKRATAKKGDDIRSEFALRIKEATKNIFEHFDKKGYIIPWIEWNSEKGTDKQGNPTFMTDDQKIDYLKVYGCVYPRDADRGSKENPYLTLKTDAPQLQDEYEKLIAARDDAIKQLYKKLYALPMEDESVVLNVRQKEMDEAMGLDALTFESESTDDEEPLIFALKFTDIFYGAVQNQTFEDPKLEYDCLEALGRIYEFKAEGAGLPGREKLINLFQGINNDQVQEAAKTLQNYRGWDYDESVRTMKGYLLSVRPVAKDLKDIPDAVWFRFYGGSEAVEPEKVEALLQERARKHMAEFKGKLPPVL